MPYPVATKESIILEMPIMTRAILIFAARSWIEADKKPTKEIKFRFVPRGKTRFEADNATYVSKRDILTKDVDKFLDNIVARYVHLLSKAKLYNTWFDYQIGPTLETDLRWATAKIKAYDENLNPNARLFKVRIQAQTTVECSLIVEADNLTEARTLAPLKYEESNYVHWSATNPKLSMDQVAEQIIEVKRT